MGEILADAVALLESLRKSASRPTVALGSYLKSARIRRINSTAPSRTGRRRKTLARIIGRRLKSRREAAWMQEMRRASPCRETRGEGFLPHRSRKPAWRSASAARAGRSRRWAWHSTISSRCAVSIVSDVRGCRKNTRARSFARAPDRCELAAKHFLPGHPSAEAAARNARMSRPSRTRRSSHGGCRRSREAARLVGPGSAGPAGNSARRWRRRGREGSARNRESFHCRGSPRSRSRLRPRACKIKRRGVSSIPSSLSEGRVSRCRRAARPGRRPSAD